MDADARVLSRGEPIVQALIATIGTYLLTAIGTLPVFFFRSALAV